jgi:hypothetical protein
LKGIHLPKYSTLDAREKGEQDGAERPVRGRTVAATARAISLGDCKVSCRSGTIVFSNELFSLEMAVPCYLIFELLHSRTYSTTHHLQYSTLQYFLHACPAEKYGVTTNMFVAFYGEY